MSTPRKTKRPSEAETVVAGCAIMFIWLLTLLLGLGLTGVMIWAIIKVVLHFT